MIVDTSALVAVLFGEPEADGYTRIIHDADRCLISAGSFLELSIVIERQTGPEVALQCDMFFRRAGIVVEPFTMEQAHIARQAFHDFGEGRHAAGLNFGDCFAYALAKVNGDLSCSRGRTLRKLILFQRYDVSPVSMRALSSNDAPLASQPPLRKAQQQQNQEDQR
jgi:ribonuclease VapC